MLPWIDLTPDRVEWTHRKQELMTLTCAKKVIGTIPHLPCASDPSTNAQLPKVCVIITGRCGKTGACWKTEDSIFYVGNENWM